MKFSVGTEGLAGGEKEGKVVGIGLLWGLLPRRTNYHMSSLRKTLSRNCDGGSFQPLFLVSIFAWLAHPT